MSTRSSLPPSAPAARLIEPGTPLVIGHRGASAHAPENTIVAFALALEQGADALEMDVRVTRDGTVIVLHDASLDRTTGGSGLVSGLTTREVCAPDAGARFTADGGASYPYRDRDVRVPTFAEVLEAFPDVPLLVEVKTVAAMAPLAAVVRRHGAEGQIVPAAYAHEALESFRRPPFIVGASMRDIARLYFGALARVPPREAPYRLLAVPDRWRGLPVPTPGFIRAARRLGAAVHVWTVDDPAAARRLWANGVAGIVTNDPAGIVPGRGGFAAG